MDRVVWGKTFNDVDLQQKQGCKVSLCYSIKQQKEVTPLCVRFVDKENKICEEFRSFQCLERIWRQDIGQAIVETLGSLQIPVEDMRAQCFADAANNPVTGAEPKAT